ncbi:MAG: hypothetical protein JSU00_07000 [Acidobacteria bacterium]|nr:hypothetical protein [Acidobacteriota bacterium]
MFSQHAGVSVSASPDKTQAVLVVANAAIRSRWNNHPVSRNRKLRITCLHPDYSARYVMVPKDASAGIRIHPPAAATN